jgi:NitT/TauT family transport system permease protein
VNRLVIPGIAIAFVTLIGIWELIVSRDPFLRFLVGQPSFIGSALVTDVLETGLLGHVAYTLSAAVLGLIIGGAIGAIAGFGVAYNKTGDVALSPILNVLSVVPLFAIGPMTIFWFGQGIASKVFLAALAAALLSAALIYQHVRSTPSAMKALVSVMARNRAAIFWRVEAPYASLSLLTNTRALFGVAVSGAVIGEFIGANRGVGHYIIIAEGLYDVNRIWAGVLALSLGAVLLAWFGIRLENFARARL